MWVGVATGLPVGGPLPVAGGVHAPAWEGHGGEVGGDGRAADLQQTVGNAAAEVGHLGLVAAAQLGEGLGFVEQGVIDRRALHGIIGKGAAVGSQEEG